MQMMCGTAVLFKKLLSVCQYHSNPCFNGYFVVIFHVLHTNKGSLSYFFCVCFLLFQLTIHLWILFHYVPYFSSTFALVVFVLLLFWLACFYLVVFFCGFDFYKTKCCSIYFSLILQSLILCLLVLPLFFRLFQS